MKNLLYLLFVLLISVTATLLAEVRLPKMLSDGVVFQRNAEMKWWGTANPGEDIVLTFNNKHYKTRSDNQGKWAICIPAQPAGGPFVVKVNNLTINNVLIGDVFLCSGQSNMELPIARVLDLYKDEVADYSNDKIHYVKTPLNSNFQASQEDVVNGQCRWLTLEPSQANSFSALCYFFAKEYNRQHQVPVGIINSSIGGTPVESWISEEAIKKYPEYYNELQICKDSDYTSAVQQLGMLTQQNWMKVLNHGALSTKSVDNWNPASLFSADWGFDGLRPINGLHLFKKAFIIEKSQVGKNAILRMGCIVDADSILINGHFVGSTGYQYPPRIYKVPSSYLKEGVNEIEVRLISYSGVPCFVPEKPYKLIFEDSEISMKEGWMHRLAVKMPAKPDGITLHYKPCCLYNGMISPLLNFKFTGVVWYQGESNIGRYNDYAPLLKTLIADWRTRLNEPDLPFVVVQLPNFMHPQSPEQINWRGLQSAQKEVAETTSNTVLVVTTDLGEWNDIHPLHKQEVGNRIANQLNTLLYLKN